jgi:hypothetical protein
MKKQISFIAPGQTAKALILVYLTFSVPIVLLGVLVAFIRYGSVELSTVFSALLLNAILGFVLLWIACHAYNWVASRFGGIEIQLSDPCRHARRCRRHLFAHARTGRVRKAHPSVCRHRSRRA